MLRTLFTPRWLTLLGVVIAVCVAFGYLGAWQLSVAQHDAIRELQAEQEALTERPLHEVLTPHAPFTGDLAGQPVVVEGSYDAARQFLVPHRVLDGQDGYWVVTPLMVGDGGSVLAVLRGFVTDPELADQPPAAPVTVRGELAPGESPYFGEEPVPDGQRGTIDLSALANEWPERFYNAFLFSTSEEPQLTAEAVDHVPPPRLAVGDVDWRNLGYALQWWVFAAFAVFMYWKMLRDASGARSEVQAPDGGEPEHSGQRPTVDAAPTDERIEPHHV